MKMKSLLFVLGLGLLAASCTDKKAAEEMAKMKSDMRIADSICMADKQMLMDSIASIQATLDSLMMPKNATSSNTTKSGSTKTTTTTTDKMDTKGKSTDVDMETKGKSSENVDMKTKGKSSKTTDDD